MLEYLRSWEQWRRFPRRDPQAVLALALTTPGVEAVDTPDRWASDNVFPGRLGVRLAQFASPPAVLRQVAQVRGRRRGSMRIPGFDGQSQRIAGPCRAQTPERLAGNSVIVGPAHRGIIAVMTAGLD